MSRAHPNRSDDDGASAGGDQRLLTIGVALAAMLFVVLAIGPPLLGQRVFLATDMLAHVPPYQSTSTPEAPQNFCVTDTIDAVFPQRAEIRNRAWDGDFPLWSSAVNGGGPLAASPDVGMLSPLNIGYWILPLWLAPAVSKVLELAAAIGFTYLFLRRLSLGQPAALLGGLVYAASGFMVVWTNWPHTLVAALIPALFWATERFLQMRTVRAAMPISVVAAVMLLQGFPAVTGWSVYAVGAYVVIRWLTRRRDSLARAAGDLAGVGGALLLGFGLAAIQIVPFLNRLSDLGVEERSGTEGLPRVGLATMAVPDAFGSCGGKAKLAHWGPMLDLELNTFVGVVALVLVLVAVTRRAPNGLGRGTRGFFAGAALLSVVLLFGGGIVLDAFQQLPVFDINPVGRLRSLLGFFFAVLAAIGFEIVARRERARDLSSGRRRLAVMGAWLAALVVIALVMLDARSVAEERGQLPAFNDVMMLPIALGLATIATIVGCFRLRGRWRIFLLATLPFLFIAQALPWASSYWPRSDRELLYPSTSAHRFLSERIGGDRFISDGLTMYPYASALYGLRAVTGHTFPDSRWREALVAVDPAIFKSRTHSSLPADPTLATSPMFDRLGARYFVASPHRPVIGTAPVRLSQTAGVVDLAPGSPLHVEVGSSGLRALGVVLAAPTTNLDPQAELVVKLIDAAGRVRARGSRLLPPNTPAGDFYVAVPGDSIDVEAGDGPMTAQITLRHASSNVSLEADQVGAPVLVVQQTQADGLEIVFSNGVVVYERTQALPRIRWTSEASVIGGEEARLEYLTTQPADQEEVVLSSAGPEPSGLQAQVHVLEDSGDTIRVRVDARGDGYLTIADPLSAGWSATIDGRAAEIAEAEHTGGAVFVEAGEHEVVFQYVPAGWRAGIIVSALSLFVLVALSFWGDRAAARLMRARSASQSREDAVPRSLADAEHARSKSGEADEST